MSRPTMQTVRNMYPGMFREMATGREGFVTEFRLLMKEFKERNSDIVYAEWAMRTSAYTPATRRMYERNIATNRKSLKLLLDRMTTVRRSLKLVDGILYESGVSDDARGRRGHAGPSDA